MSRGGTRPGAGIKTLKTEREIKERLQKMFPEVYKAINKSLNGERNTGSRATTAFRVLDKFIGDKKDIDTKVDVNVKTGVVVLPELHKDKKTDSVKGDTE